MGALANLVGLQITSMHAGGAAGGQGYLRDYYHCCRCYARTCYCCYYRTCYCCYRCYCYARTCYSCCCYTHTHAHMSAATATHMRTWVSTWPLAAVHKNCAALGIPDSVSVVARARWYTALAQATGRACTTSGIRTTAAKMKQAMETS